MEALIQKTHAEISGALKGTLKKRKRVLFFQKIIWMIAGCFFLLMFLNILSTYFSILKSDIFKFLVPTPSNPYAMIYPMIALVALLYPMSDFFVKAFQKFKVQEHEAITKMVSMLFPKVEFSQSINTPDKEVLNSKLFAWVKKDTPIHCYGQIRNTINDNQVNIADLGIIEKDVGKQFAGTLMRIPILNLLVIVYQYILKNIFSNKTADNVQYTYRGMFCWLSFKKPLKGHTVILTNNQSSKMNRHFSSSFKKEQRILLEDPRFTDQFVVYSTDQIEARYVLSIALMERVVELKKKFNRPIQLSFHNHQMYLAVNNEHGLFSFPGGLDSIKIVEELANDIETALHISASLKIV